MKKEPVHRCYNSGPISSLTFITALNNFRAADTVISEWIGMKPVNPMEVTWGLRPSASWWLHMVKDILLLLSCKAVYFQNGWIRSRGARIEYRWAKWTGKQMYFETQIRHCNKSHIERSEK